MAVNPVAIEQLRVMAETFLTAELPYFEELREAFKLLKHTGCRIQEIFDISRWSIVSGYTVTVQPQKGNNPRTIILNSDFNNFLAAIAGQYKPFLGRTYSQLQFIFQKINPYGKLYSSTKEITNYFFRYLFVRELEYTGLTIQQIADEMGYTSTTAVNNYLNADLSSTIEVPVTPSDPLPEGHIDIFTVSGVFNGATDNFIIQNVNTSEQFSFYAEFETEITTDQFLIDLNSHYQNYLYPRLTAKKFGNYYTLAFAMRRRATFLNPAFSGNIFYPPKCKFFVSVDFSQVGSSGGFYRNVFTHRSYNGIDFINNSALNQNTQYAQAPLFIIGCQKTAAGVVSNAFQGIIHKFYKWNRILSNDEVLTMFNL